MHVRGCNFFFIFLVYLATANVNRNKEIIKTIGNNIRKYEEERLIILGDFNGHVGFLGPQDLNKNGRAILQIMEDHNLTMLNADPACSGEITWKKGNQKITIDFVLTNERMYQHFSDMSIDEDKEKTDISDHLLIDTNFKFKHGRKEKFIEEWNEIKYRKIDDTTKGKYLERLTQLINQNMTISQIESAMNTAADETMTKKIRRKKTADRKDTEAIWFNENIRKEISKRREINKRKRKARNEEEIENLNTQYKKQKLKVQIMVRDARTKHEKQVSEKILSDPNRSKKLWKHIDTLKGKENKEKEVSVYEENKIIQGAQLSKKLEEYWKTIYQNGANDIPKIWNNDLKNKYENEINKTNQSTFEIFEQDCDFPIQYKIPDRLIEHFEMAVTIRTSPHMMPL